MGFKDYKDKALYRSENGYLFNIDCLEILKSLPDASVDLVVTDPPYKVTSRGSSGNTGGMLTKDINKKGKVFDFNSIEISDWLPEVFRVLKDGSHCYIMTNNKNLFEYQKSIIEQGFSIYKILIWDKGNVITNMYYMDSHEYIIFCRKGRAVRINNCGTKSILSITNKKTKDEDGNNLHDTEKPVELMKILVENSSTVGGTVCDPFCGIGPVALACIESDRKFICCEIDENYCKIAHERILNKEKDNE